MVDVVSADTDLRDDELSLAPARRMGDGDEPRSHKTRAGLFVGLLLCASSSAFVIWLATLLL
jgi:hypothetical protein